LFRKVTAAAMTAATAVALAHVVLYQGKGCIGAVGLLTALSSLMVPAIYVEEMWVKH
jgi:hypothetical protein